MLELTFQEILEATEGTLLIQGESNSFHKVSTDTRKIENGSIFIALKGDNFNGNNYVNEASNKGAIICIVDEVLFDKTTVNKNTSIILVNNTRDALLSLAKFYRNKLGIKVVGVTGSTGKTSTKDLLAAVLSEKYKVFKTKGNFNNEIGLPLMILELDSSYEIAILEMGMSNLGEIHKLAEVATPDMAVITNIGISHIENLKTRENILKAKMEVVDYFKENNLLVVNGDDDLLTTIKEIDYKLLKTGIETSNNIWAEEIELSESGSTFTICDGKEKNKFSLNVPGKHNIQNLLLAVAIAKSLSVSYEEMESGLSNLEATSMRLDIVKLEGYTLINDCYNSSPSSVKSAIDVEMSIKGNRRIAILGTMKELGHESLNAHRDIGKYASLKGIDQLFLVGEFTEATKEGFGEKATVFGSKEELIEKLPQLIEKDDVVLVKASRSMKFEDITKELTKITF